MDCSLMCLLDVDFLNMMNDGDSFTARQNVPCSFFRCLHRARIWCQ